MISLERNKQTATVTLNRPETHNALNAELITALKEAFLNLADDENARVVVIRAEGKSFCAGGDLNWMKESGNISMDENIAEAQNLADMLKAINTLPKPTICLVQGAAYGGGLGIPAACDMVLATQQAKFCLSEVKIGLAPAVIAPYVYQAIGERAMRRYALTGETIDAMRAKELGLVHEIFSESTALENRMDELTGTFLKNGPEAMAVAKKMIFDTRDNQLDDAFLAHTVEVIARRRASEEGQEGINAFFEKRQPKWTAA